MIAYYLHICVIATIFCVSGFCLQNEARTQSQISADKLVSAIRAGDLQSAHSILHNGIDLNSRDSKGETALIQSN